MRFQYVLTEAFRNIGRNALVVLGAILAVFVSLLLTFGTLVFGEVVERNTQQWADDVRVIAFLSDDVGFAETDQMVAEVQGWPEVEEAFYFSKPEALIEAERLLRNQPAALRMFQEDPSLLPASIRVRPVEADQYDLVEQRLAAMVGVEEIRSAGPAVDNLIALRNVLRLVAWVLAIGLGIAAVLLIANTIHMAIFARREEIGIMRLVGASNWFVRTPFLVEGVIEGVVGAGLAVGVVVVMYQMLASGVEGLPAWIDVTVAGDFFVRGGVVMVVLGALTGLIGSGLSVAFYLWRK